MTSRHSRYCAVALILSCLSIATNLTLLKAPLHRLHETSLHETEARLRDYSERYYQDGYFYENYVSRWYKDTVNHWNEIYDDDFFRIHPIDKVDPSWDDVHNTLADVVWQPVKVGTPTFIKSVYTTRYDDVLLKIDMGFDELSQWKSGLGIESSFEAAHKSDFYTFAESPHWQLSTNAISYQRSGAVLSSRTDTNNTWLVFALYEAETSNHGTLFILFSKDYPYGVNFNPEAEKVFIQNVRAVYRKRHTKGIMKNFFSYLRDYDRKTPVGVVADAKYEIPLIGFRSTRVLYYPTTDQMQDYLYLENTNKNWSIIVFDPKSSSPESVDGMEQVTDYVFWKKHH